MKLTNKQYDILKYVAQIVLPGIATFYFTIATIWKLPLAEEVVGTITALDLLLGTLLGISTAKLKKEVK